jgi:hypothetical protein
MNERRTAIRVQEKSREKGATADRLQSGGGERKSIGGPNGVWSRISILLKNPLFLEAREMRSKSGQKLCAQMAS